MKINDNKFSNEFVNYIKILIKNELNKAKYNRKIRATVVSVGIGVATITLLDSTQQITNVKIRDGLIINPADEVYVECINGNINNMFIDIKI